jgi:hypothetical protein
MKDEKEKINVVRCLLMDPHDESVYLIELNGDKLVSMEKICRLIHPTIEEEMQWGTTD